jgi:GT2 family glycosyltransferase
VRVDPVPGGPGTPQTITAVIRTRNRLALLRRTFSALLEDPALSEIVVVDDGSTDGTADWLADQEARHDRVRVVSLGGVGAPEAQVRGVHEARGDVVLIFDDDVVPRAPVGAGHLRHHQANERVVVCGYNPIVVTRRSPATVRLVARLYEQWADAIDVDPETLVIDESRNLFELWASQVSVRRADLAEVPISNPSFRAHRSDDHEFTIRAREAGFRFVFDRSLVADHVYARTLDQFCHDNFEHGRGRVEIYLLHPDALGPVSPSLYTRPGRGRVFDAFLRATDNPQASAVVVSTLKALARLTEAVHAYRLAEGILRILAIVGQRRGVFVQLERSEARSPPELAPS